MTQKVIKKKQKKGSAAGRFTTKMISNDSFFNYFDPSLKELKKDDNDDEGQELLRCDFETGQLIRDQIIPRAVLFFTGEAVDEDEFFDEDENTMDVIICFKFYLIFIFFRSQKMQSKNKLKTYNGII